LDHLAGSTPVFDKSSEEGLQFRIYRLGSLEVRTTKVHEGEEVIGAVFSICASQTPKAAARGPLPADWEQEKISKVSSYVEHAFVQGGDASSLGCRYYLVLETEMGNKILSERLSDRQLSWVENPKELEDRNSLAKLTRSETCSTGVTVRDMVEYRMKQTKGSTPSSKRYVKATFNRAAGSKSTRKNYVMEKR